MTDRTLSRAERGERIEKGVGSVISDVDMSKAAEPTATQEISVKGRRRRVPALKLKGAIIVTRGSLVKVAEVFDEYWLEADALPDARVLLSELAQRPDRPDVFTFTQRVPESDPRFEFYYEWTTSP